CAAIGGILGDADGAPACRFDPMGEEVIHDALELRRKLQRLARIDASARRMAREMSSTMVAEMRAHLQQSPFASSFAQAPTGVDSRLPARQSDNSGARLRPAVVVRAMTENGGRPIDR